MSRHLQDRRILVVEDEALILLSLEDALTGAGGVPVSAADLETALALAQREDFDGAYLDINLAGQEVYPVANVLVSRKIPFVIASGYGPETIASEFRDVRLLTKPFTQDEFLSELSRIVLTD